ncbi:FemAB family protein [uncultured archaeon]|nr:FemAB family protein [uncultured archaeon]
MKENDSFVLEEISPWVVYQSKDWKRIKESSGKKPVTIEVENKGEINAQILAFEQILQTPFGKKQILFAEGLPLFKEEEDLKKVLNLFKKASKKYFYGVIFPTVLSDKNTFFEEEGYSKISNYTILLDLEKPESELFKNLEKKSSRWGVKFAEKQGLSFEEATEEELPLFYEMYLKTTEDGGFNPESYEFFKQLFTSKIGKIFIVKKEKKLLAGGAVLLDKDYAILNLTSSTEEGHKFQAMPFFYWNIIRYTKSLNKKYLDFGGYDAEAKEGDKTFAVNKFKERFGGKIVEQPIYSTNKKYFLIRKLMRKARFIKKLYKKQ